jgi:hypothetical protein
LSDGDGGLSTSLGYYGKINNVKDLLRRRLYGISQVHHTPHTPHTVVQLDAALHRCSHHRPNTHDNGWLLAPLTIGVVAAMIQACPLEKAVSKRGVGWDLLVWLGLTTRLLPPTTALDHLLKCNDRRLITQSSAAVCERSNNEMAVRGQ